MRQDRLLADVKIDWNHHLVHSEKLYSSSYSNTVGGSATVAVHITTPATGRVHIDFTISANKSGVIAFSEGDTLAGGTALAAYNNDRNSGNSASSVLKHDATISAAGTTLRTIVLGAGQTTRISLNTEFILKPSTAYSVVFTADGASTTAAINADFYEV